MLKITKCPHCEADLEPFDNMTDEEALAYKIQKAEEMYVRALECVLRSGVASTASLQVALKIGYARASYLIDRMEEEGMISPKFGSMPRQVLFTDINDRFIG